VKEIVSITMERFNELNKAEIMCKMYKRMYEALKKIKKHEES